MSKHNTQTNGSSTHDRKTKKEKLCAVALPTLFCAALLFVAFSAYTKAQMPPAPLPGQPEGSAYVRQGNLLVLMYHEVDPTPPVDKASLALYTTPEKLTQDIDDLLGLGYTPISLVDYYNGQAQAGHNYFAITFDDGYQGVYQYAFPLLQELQVPASVFFNTGMEADKAFLHYWQLQEMAQSGFFTIYSHLAYHERATKLPAGQFECYLQASLDFLQKYVGDQGPMFLAYPYGDYNRATYDTARAAGIKLQFAQKMQFPAADVLVRVNVPYNVQMQDLLKKAPLN